MTLTREQIEAWRYRAAAAVHENRAGSWSLTDRELVALCDMALSRAAEPPTGTERSFWVVERWEDSRSIGYWDGGSSRHFVTDIDKAIQFCRKQDAFWTTRGWHWKDTKICEHMYVAASPPAREDRDAVLEEFAKTLDARVEWLFSEAHNGGNWEHLKARADEAAYIAKKARALKSEAATPAAETE